MAKDNKEKMNKPIVISGEKGTESGFFTSPEFLTQLGSQFQDLARRPAANRLVQTALATSPFNPAGSQAILGQSAASGLGEPIDPIGSTLKSSAIRQLRMREEREAKQKERLNRLRIDSLRKELGLDDGEEK